MGKLYIREGSKWRYKNGERILTVESCNEHCVTGTWYGGASLRTENIPNEYFYRSWVEFDSEKVVADIKLLNNILVALYEDRKRQGIDKVSVLEYTIASKISDGLEWLYRARINIDLEHPLSTEVDGEDRLNKLFRIANYNHKTSYF